MAYQAKVFDSGFAKMLSGNYDPAHAVKLAVVDDAVIPTTTQVDPALTDFTEVLDAGTYTLGGTDLGLLGNLITTAGGVIVFDSPINPQWLQDSNNSANARWGIIYDSSDPSQEAFGYVDFGGVVNMQLGTLLVTWAVSGIFRIQRP